MRTRTHIAMIISPIVNAVLFGVSATLVLSVPSLREHMVSLIPAAVAVSILATPFIAWNIAPRLRARQSHGNYIGNKRFGQSRAG